MELHKLSETLESLSDKQQAYKLQRHNKCLRGIRGVSPGEVAKVAVQFFEKRPTALPRDVEALDSLFGTAFEDGLAAITLLAPLATEAPEEVIDLALKWTSQVDDAQTADALGWGVMGPLLLVDNSLYDEIKPLHKHSSPWTRRVIIMAAMAALPIPVEGPVASCIRAKLGQKTVRFVDTAMNDWLTVLLNASLRDTGTPVRKAVRRVVGAWGLTSPDEAEYWADSFPGGIPKMIRADLEKNLRKGRKRLRVD